MIRSNSNAEEKLNHLNEKLIRLEDECNSLKIVIKQKEDEIKKSNNELSLNIGNNLKYENYGEIIEKYESENIKLKNDNSRLNSQVAMYSDIFNKNDDLNNELNHFKAK